MKKEWASAQDIGDFCHKHKILSRRKYQAAFLQGQLPDNFPSDPYQTLKVNWGEILWVSVATCREFCQRHGISDSDSYKIFRDQNRLPDRFPPNPVTAYRHPMFFWSPDDTLTERSDTWAFYNQNTQNTTSETTSEIATSQSSEGSGGMPELLRPVEAETTQDSDLSPIECFSPEEIPPSVPFLEGSVTRISVNRYERNLTARKQCIQHYGTSCCICKFNFEEMYGELGQGFIHIHHLIPISDIAEEYVVDPIVDLRPVCPNCHAMLHRRNPPYSISEIQALLSES